MIENEIAERLRYLFRVNKINRSKLAKQINVSSSLIRKLSNVENPAKMYIPTLYKLSEALGVSIIWLITGKDKSQINQGLCSRNELFILQCLRGLDPAIRKDIDNLIISIKEKTNVDFNKTLQ